MRVNLTSWGILATCIWKENNKSVKGHSHSRLEVKVGYKSIKFSCGNFQFPNPKIIACTKICAFLTSLYADLWLMVPLHCKILLWYNINILSRRNEIEGDRDWNKEIFGAWTFIVSLWGGALWQQENFGDLKCSRLPGPENVLGIFSTNNLPFV